jgi:hypothetical protein
MGGDAGRRSTVVAGLRYRWYDKPPGHNEYFFERNGFANTETLDGEGPAAAPASTGR